MRVAVYFAVRESAHDVASGERNKIRGSVTRTDLHVLCERPNARNPTSHDNTRALPAARRHAGMAPKKKTKQHPITVVHNFGGRRCTGEPPSVEEGEHDDPSLGLNVEGAEDEDFGLGRPNTQMSMQAETRFVGSQY